MPCHIILDANNGVELIVLLHQAALLCRARVNQVGGDQKSSKIMWSPTVSYSKMADDEFLAEARCANPAGNVRPKRKSFQARYACKPW